MGVPVAAVAVGVGGFLSSREAKRRESHIQDRVSKYQGFPDEQLRAIIRDYGGEMGEAAQRVLAQRGTSTVTPTAPAQLAESVTRDSSGVMMLALVGVVVFLLILKR